MGEKIELVPLHCVRCDTAVPAGLDEAAWVCQQCGQGLALDEEKGLLPIQVYYQAGIPIRQPGKPYWVVEGKVQLSRQVYGGKNETQAAAMFWAAPRRFFIPAYSCPLETLSSLGPRLLIAPPNMQPGPVSPFEPVTLSLRDLPAIAEVIALAIEAERKDFLKQIGLTILLSEPVLWILKD